MNRQLHNVQDWAALARRCNYNCSRAAAELGVSCRHLRRYTARRFGFAPKEYFRRLRMERAPGLLHKCLSVKEVAFELGFKDVSHFDQEFRHRYSVKPSQCALCEGHSASLVTCSLLNACAQCLWATMGPAAGRASGGAQTAPNKQTEAAPIHVRRERNEDFKATSMRREVPIT
jgi:AraC-like DNA-binding protein